MLTRKCEKIIDSLDIDEDGNFIFDQNMMEHIKTCRQCRIFYERIQGLSDDDIPDCEEAVMAQIREIEEEKASRSWVQRFFPRPVTVTAAALAALVLILSLGYVLYSPVLSRDDGYANLVNLEKDESLVSVNTKIEKRIAKINKLDRKHTSFFELDNS